MMVWEGLFRYGCPGCFRDQAIDVVVTDIKLAPGEPHGLALARMIRHKNLRMPIILMTVDPQLIEGEALPGSLLKNHLGLRPPVGVETAEVYPLCVEGSGRRLFGGSFPAKKHGPWVVARVRVVTPSGDPD
jgi:hypothetical protein